MEGVPPFVLYGIKHTRREPSLEVDCYQTIFIKIVLWSARFGDVAIYPEQILHDNKAKRHQNETQTSVIGHRSGKPPCLPARPTGRQEQRIMNIRADWTHCPAGQAGRHGGRPLRADDILHKAKTPTRASRQPYKRCPNAVQQSIFDTTFRHVIQGERACIANKENFTGKGIFTHPPLAIAKPYMERVASKRMTFLVFETNISKPVRLASSY